MSEQAADLVVPVTVMTGFLGSGKTTLLNRLVESVGDLAVIINEFGEIGLDHLLVREAEENLVELDSGCLCCTIRGDLVITMTDLAQRREKGEISFSRLIIETTGLADPTPILGTLLNDPNLEERYALDGVITLVDAVNGENTMNRHKEAIKQVAVADRLVITKADLLKKAERAGKIDVLYRRLRHINPSAVLLQGGKEGVDTQALFDAGLIEKVTQSKGQSGPAADGHPEVLHMTSPERVKRWLGKSAFEEGRKGHDHHHHEGHHHGDHHHCGPDCDHPDHQHDHDGDGVKSGGSHGNHHHHHDVNRHDETIQAFCVTREQPITSAGFQLFIEFLMMFHSEQMLRVKGIVHLEEQPETPAVIHGVQHIIHPVEWLDAWPDEDRRTRLVFITDDIPKEHIAKALNALDEKVRSGEITPGEVFGGDVDEEDNARAV